MKRSRGLRLALLFILLAVSGPRSTAQTTNATVTGEITDQSSKVVPGATVLYTNINTGVAYQTSTNGEGIYTLPTLEPGVYRANISKDGFKSIVKPDIELHVQDVASINFQLQVGSISETVTVEAGGLNIDTTDATVSTTIDRNFAENLPLNGRSFQTLILLAPGTSLAPSSANGGTFSVNGQRANANSFTVDGVSANLGGFVNGSFGSTGQLSGSNPNFTIAGTTQGMVSVDALQEFKIQTSSYAPEFGRQPGGQISLLTRSGTNDFHGTALDYFRNTIFDANNWFNGYTNNPPLPKGKEEQNDFGGTFGGPIFKDKMFFFFSYEGLRLLQPVTGLYTVPSIRLRQEAAPAYKSILNSWPIPDGPEFTTSCDPTIDPTCPPSGQEPTGGAPYTLSQSLPTTQDSYGIKIDHTFGDRLRLFGRYSYVTSSTSNFADSNQVLTDKLKSQGLTLGMDVTVRTDLQDELRLNYSTNVSTQDTSFFGADGGHTFDTSVLYPSPIIQGVDYTQWELSLPYEFFAFTNGSQGKYSERQIQVIDNASHAIGRHQLKWGVDYRRLFPISARNPVEADYVVTSESDLISGNLSEASTTSNLTTHPIFTNFSAYVQDAWRASSRASVTYGLRWELNLVPGERNGIFPPNVIGLNNPATATLAPSGPPYKTTYDNFAPRLGVAYQLRQTPDRETVIRGGFGLFYDLNSETYGAGLFSVQNTSSALTNLAFPIAANVLPILPVPPPLTPPFNRIFAIDPNLKLPLTLQWSVSVEQGLGKNQSLTASYVASAGYRLLRTDELFNFNPDFLLIFATRNAAASNYQSLQLQYNRRLSHGLQVLAQYTYSHSIDNASDAGAAYSGSTVSTSPTGTGFLNPNIDRGNSDFDMRHALRGALTYHIPTWSDNLVSKAILGGWSVDTIGIAQSALPVNLIGGYYFPPPVYPTLELRPDLVAGEPLYLYGSACAAVHAGTPCPGGRGFNPAAFTPVSTDANGNPTQDQGTLGRNVMRGFGAWQMDFALHRQFRLTERVNLQFRGEFFNLFNHPNFGFIDDSVGDGDFGIATATLNKSLSGLNSLYQIGGPRSIQLALKLVF